VLPRLLVIEVSALVAVYDLPVLEIEPRGDADDPAPQIEARRLVDARQIVMDYAIAPRAAPGDADI